MGLRNVLHGTVLKATPERIQLRWRGQTLGGGELADAIRICPPPDSPLALLRPARVRARSSARTAESPIPPTT